MKLLVSILGMIFAIEAVLGQNGAGPAVVSLPSGAELILKTPYSAGFNCEGRKYGFYADPGNGCQVFHVCVPIEGDAGVIDTIQYSFFCGNQTLFNQEHLTCDHPDEVDCAAAESLYSVNDNFGVVPPKV